MNAVSRIATPGALSLTTRRGAGEPIGANVYAWYIQLMIDLGRVEGFEWDDGNSLKSSEKHSVSRAEAEQVFLGAKLFVLEDEKHSGEERRLHALGATDDRRRLHVTFPLRDTDRLIRIISARDMSRKERALYEQEA